MNPFSRASLNAGVAFVAWCGFGAAAIDAPLVWSLPKGSVVRREFLREGELRLESMERVIDGETHVAPDEIRPAIELKQSLRLVVRDTLEAVDEHAPTQLLREYETVTCTRAQSTAPPGKDAMRTELAFETALEGRRVRWKQDDGSWSARFADLEDGTDAAKPDDEELLTGLIGDLDWLRALPDGDVEDGREWALEAETLRGWLRPGGRLSLIQGEETAAESNAREAELDANLEGKLTATYRGEREHDGVRSAVIALTLEFETYGEEQLPGREQPDGTQGPTADRKLSYGYELEGEILWDRAAGCAREGRLSGDVTFVQSTVAQIETPDGSKSFEERLRFAGKNSYEFHFEIQQ